MTTNNKFSTYGAAAVADTIQGEKFRGKAEQEVLLALYYAKVEGRFIDRSDFDITNMWQGPDKLSNYANSLNEILAGIFTVQVKDGAKKIDLPVCFYDTSAEKPKWKRQSIDQQAFNVLKMTVKKCFPAVHALYRAYLDSENEETGEFRDPFVFMKNGKIKLPFYLFIDEEQEAKLRAEKELTDNEIELPCTVDGSKQYDVQISFKQLHKASKSRLGIKAGGGGPAETKLDAKSLAKPAADLAAFMAGADQAEWFGQLNAVTKSNLIDLCRNIAASFAPSEDDPEGIDWSNLRSIMAVQREEDDTDDDDQPTEDDQADAA